MTESYRFAASGAGAGAIFILGASGVLEIVNSTISGNTGSFAAVLNRAGLTDITNSTFVGNAGSFSGGVAVWVGMVSMKNVVFADNTDTGTFSTVDDNCCRLSCHSNVEGSVFLATTIAW